MHLQQQLLLQHRRRLQVRQRLQVRVHQRQRQHQLLQVVHQQRRRYKGEAAHEDYT